MSAAYSQLLAQLMRDRCASRVAVRMTWFIVACVAGDLLCTMYAIKPPFGHALLVWLIGCIGYLWFGTFVKSATRQNQPAYACLVPGLRSRLMTLTALLFLACTLAATALAAVLIGHAGYALVCAGMFGVYMLFAQRYPAVNFLVLLLPFMGMWPLDKLLAAADAIGEPMVAGVGAIAVILLGMLGVRIAFPQGGDRHWDWHRRLGREAARLNGAVPAAGAAPGPRWTVCMRFAYLSALRRDSRGGASQGRMMLHTLGMAAYDGNGIAFVLASTLAMALAGRHVAGLGDPEVMRMAGSAMQGCLLMASLMYAVAASSSAARFGVEQGLYRLTPAAPAASRLNRVLARALLLRCLRLWLISLAGAACIDAVIFGQLRGVTYALATLTLPFVGLTLRNYAAMRRRTGESAALAGTLLLVLLYIAVLMLERMLPAFPWFWAGSAVALATAIGLGLGWRRMMALPPALPAGRRAS